MKLRKIVALLLTVFGATALLARLKIYDVNHIHSYNIGALIGGACGLYIFYRIIAGPQK
jgi:uncharacterized membrane protein